MKYYYRASKSGVGLVNFRKNITWDKLHAIQYLLDLIYGKT